MEVVGGKSEKKKVVRAFWCLINGTYITYILSTFIVIIVEELRSKKVHVHKVNHKTVTTNFNEMKKKINVLKYISACVFSC